MTDYNQFFCKVFSEALCNLKPETTPQWGRMTAIEMIHHLRLGMKMSLASQEGKISIPPEKLPINRRFLMSDQALNMNLERPKSLVLPVLANDLNWLKSDFLKDLKRLAQYFKEHPVHILGYDFLSLIDAAQWTHLYYKYFRHHFVQCGLMPE